MKIHKISIILMGISILTAIFSFLLNPFGFILAIMYGIMSLVFLFFDIIDYQKYKTEEVIIIDARSLELIRE